MVKYGGRRMKFMTEDISLLETLHVAMDSAYMELNVANKKIEILNKGTHEDTANGTYNEFVIKLFK